MSEPAIDIFLTGASGFLGHHVLAELLARPNVRCRVLLRPPVATSGGRLAELLGELGFDLSSLIANGRVAAIEGTLPGEVSSAMVSGAGMILHCAGDTTFRANGSGEPERTNVDGTRALLEAATRANVRRFLLVSTAYVCGEQTGHISETYHSAPPPSRNDYERSKWQAERLVWTWARRGRVATICRPSILFGDSRTGRASALRGLYVVARATEILARAVDSGDEMDRHRIPLRILGRADATCNVVPVDWAARQIARIVVQPDGVSEVWHITNPDPPSHEEIKQWLEAYFDIAGGWFSDDAWPLTDANHYEDLFYSLGNICLDYFRHGLSFASRCAEDVPAGKRLVDRDSFLRSICHAQATNWGRSRAESGDPRPPNGHIDPKWYFERFLPSAVARSTVAKVEALTATVGYTITGSYGGNWISRFERGHIVETHAAPCALKPEFEYSLSYDDLVNVITCRRPLQEIFFHGSAEMSGNVERALKMVSIIGAFLREFPLEVPEKATLTCQTNPR
jgi:nucleoside-diphosphate-sugar epimerase